MFSSDQSRHYLFAFVAILGISLSPIFVKLSDVGVISTGFFRFFIALPFLWGWMIYEQSNADVEHLPRKIKDYMSLFMSGAFLGLDIIFWHWSLENTHIANSMLLNNMTSILVALYAWLVWKEKITAFTVLGILAATIGAVVLVTDGGHIDGSNFKGDMQAIVSAVFYSAYLLSVKHLRNKFSAVTILSWGGLASVYVLALVAFTMETKIVPTSFYGWFILIALALVGQILGQGMLSYAMRFFSAAFSAVMITFVPVLSSLFAWAIFGQSLTFWKIFGGIIILTGIIITKISEIKTHPKLKQTITE